MLRVLKELYGSNFFVLNSVYMNVWNRKKEFLMESLIGQLGLNHIFFWSNLLKKIGKCKANWQKKKIISKTIWVKLYCLWFNFLNVFEIENSMSVWWDFMKILNGQYGSNLIAHIASYSEFLRNIAKFNIGQAICTFDKWLFKFSKWTLYASRWLAWLI